MRPIVLVYKPFDLYSVLLSCGEPERFVHRTKPDEGSDDKGYCDHKGNHTQGATDPVVKIGDQNDDSDQHPDDPVGESHICFHDIHI